MKTISCKEFGINCPWVGKAKTLRELMEKATRHAIYKHNYYWENRTSMLSKEELERIMIPHVRDEEEN